MAATDEDDEPSSATRAGWLVAWIRARAPAEKSVLGWEEVENEIKAGRDTPAAGFALATAKRALIRGSPPYEFTTSKAGLLILDAAGRVRELDRRINASRRSLRETVASAATIKAEGLDEDGRRRLDRSRARAAFALGAHREKKFPALPGGEVTT